MKTYEEKAPTLRNRYSDALLSQSAVNPGAVCRSIADYQMQMLDMGMSIAQIVNDPAIKLMSYQVMYLFNVQDLSYFEYGRMTAYCQEKSK